MSYLHVEPGNYQVLVTKDPKHIQMDICDWIAHMRQSGLSSSSISTYIAALNKFYTMNDITLNWKKVHSYEGEREKEAEDRPYTHSEIKLLIENTSLRNRALLLLLSSSGPHVGAVPPLRIKDLEPIDSHNIYKITYYPKSKKFRYFSFCSPECRKEIDSYLEWRRRWGERITDESYLFRKEYNPLARDQNPDGSKVLGISTNTISVFMKKLLNDVGIRPLPIEGQNKRHNIMQCHGLRKFFETTAFRAGMDHMYIRRLMGQKSGLEDSYLKLSEEELLEGDSKHIGYIGIIDHLTISDVNRVRRENQILKIRADKADAALERIMQIEQQLGLDK